MTRSREDDPGTAGPAPPRRRAAWKKNSDAILVAVLCALFVRTYVAEAVHIPTPSMEDTLLVGDHLVVNRFLLAPGADLSLLPGRSIRRLDVVVLKAPNDPVQSYVKRVIGLPGDTVMVRGTRVFVNNRLLQESGEKGYRVWWQGGTHDYGPAVVPPDHYFLMGDNRDNSQDSRAWGPVHRRHIRGRPLFVYWSYKSERNPHLGTLRQKAERICDRILHFFTKTRWERTLRSVR